VATVRVAKRLLHTFNVGLNLKLQKLSPPLKEVQDPKNGISFTHLVRAPNGIRTRVTTLKGW
jgi:hypothetical protein